MLPEGGGIEWAMAFAPDRDIVASSTAASSHLWAFENTDLNPAWGPIHFDSQKLEPRCMMSRSYAPIINWSSFHSEPLLFRGWGTEGKAWDTEGYKTIHVSAKIWTNIHWFSPTSFPKKPKLDTTLVLSGLCAQPTLPQMQQKAHGIMSTPVLPNTTLFLSFLPICIKLAA